MPPLPVVEEQKSLAKMIPNPSRASPFLPAVREYKGPPSTLTVECAQRQPHVSLGEAQHDALMLEVLGELLQFS